MAYRLVVFVYAAWVLCAQSLWFGAVFVLCWDGGCSVVLLLFGA